MEAAARLLAPVVCTGSEANSLGIVREAIVDSGMPPGAGRYSVPGTVREAGTTAPGTTCMPPPGLVSCLLVGNEDTPGWQPGGGVLG